MKIIDCFPFFAPYNEELLYLRVNLLKDHVDKFIIVESNKTHSGLPIKRRFPEIAIKLGLPMSQIIYVEDDTPETEDLEILQLDAWITGMNAGNKESLLARVRERLQKDAVMKALDQFDDEDVFIYGDSDEIINPEYINWVTSFVYNNKGTFLKIPLVNLQGRADMRVYGPDGKPEPWHNKMVVADKKTIMKNSILKLRVDAADRPATYLTIDGSRVEDMGWHFSWMGNINQRQIKADSFSHAFDKFDWMLLNVDGYADYSKLADKIDFSEGKTAADGNIHHTMKRYPLGNLPDLIFETPFVKEFLLPQEIK